MGVDFESVLGAFWALLGPILVPMGASGTHSCSWGSSWGSQAGPWRSWGRPWVPKYFLCFFWSDVCCDFACVFGRVFESFLAPASAILDRVFARMVFLIRKARYAKNNVKHVFFSFLTTASGKKDSGLAWPWLGLVISQASSSIRNIRRS